MCTRNAMGPLLLLSGVQTASEHLGDPKTMASFNGFEAVAVDMPQERHHTYEPVYPCVHTHTHTHTCTYIYTRANGTQMGNQRYALS